MEATGFYDELNQRNEDLKILIRLIQAVHKSSNLEEIYSEALDSVMELESVDMAAIYSVDEEKREAVLEAHRNFPTSIVERAGTLIYPEGITWRAINTGKIFNIVDVHKDPHIGSAGRQLGHQTALVIPITMEEKVVGVIWFLSNKERKFNKREVNLLSNLGSQISSALAKAKILKGLKKREEELQQALAQLSKKNRYERIISAVTQSVHRSINLQDVLENAVDTMSKNIDSVDNISIYLIEGEEAVLKSHRGYPDWWTKQVRRIKYPEGFTWKTMLEGKLVYCPDAERDSVIGPAGRKMGTKSYASMPIGFRGKTVGTININSLNKDAFDEEELKLLKTVSQQIETAINNAKQAEALRQSELALRRSKNQLEIKVEERTAELIRANEQLMGEIAERKQAGKELRNSREQLRSLAARLQSVREEERRQIAREVHDELGQTLTAIKLDISWLANRMFEAEAKAGRSKIQDKLQSISNIIDNSIQEVRRIATQLRPGVLDDLGLVAAIDWQVHDFQQRTGVKCDFTSGVEYIDLDQNRATALFRILQETLTNIARHANATKVKIRLRKNNSGISLRVEDNGRGITDKEISDTKSLGLLGIKERALLFGGSVDITGRQQKGTAVAVHIPMRR